MLGAGRPRAIRLFATMLVPTCPGITSATRTWNDVNHDFVPQASELGPITNVNFGSSVITQANPEKIAPATK